LASEAKGKGMQEKGQQKRKKIANKSKRGLGEGGKGYRLGNIHLEKSGLSLRK